MYLIILGQLELNKDALAWGQLFRYGRARLAHVVYNPLLQAQLICFSCNFPSDETTFCSLNRPMYSSLYSFDRLNIGTMRSLLLFLAFLTCVVSPQVSAQQNGEVSTQDKRRHQESTNRGTEFLADGGPRVRYIDSNGQPVLVQFTYSGPPKILPIATADSYPEGSTINLICTVSGGQRKGLTLGWAKDGEELNEESVRYSTAGQLDNLSIEKTGADISILRLTNATHSNSGRFTCKAQNPLGEDSTSVNIVINGELSWLNIETRAINECNY